MKKRKLRIVQRTKFFLERQFIKGAHYQLLIVVMIIGLISVIGGMLVLPTGDKLNSLSESVWWAFLRLSDPGYLGEDEGVWKRFISTIITVAGYVVFLGSMVAIITTWLNGKIRNLEQGLAPVATNNHILVLGWSNRTIHIAAELFHSQERLRGFLKRHKSRSLNLIILAGNVTPDKVQELKDHHQIGKRAHEIILRSGDSIDGEHLRRVDSMNASTIIIPSKSVGIREFITPDVETIKTLLSLKAESLKADGDHFPFVVAEILDTNKIKAAQRAYSGPLEVIASDTIISRLIAQNVRHEGLSEIYNEVLSRNDKNNLFVRSYPALTGNSLGVVKARFPLAILLGVVKLVDNRFIPNLNMKDNYILDKDDRLVFLAREYKDTEPKEIFDNYKQPTKIGKKDKDAKPSRQISLRKKILILGWNHRIPSLINEFSTYEKETYHIDIVELRSIDFHQKSLKFIDENLADKVTYNLIEADYVKEPELRRINPAAYDNIILVSSDKLEEEEEADARTIVGYILLEEILEIVPNRPKILLELADPDNKTMIQHFNSEVIISPLILSHMLAQVALQRELYSIYNELFTVGGAEIIFRDPEDYNLNEKHITFYELEQLAMNNYNETALGFYSKKTLAENKSYLYLNPARDQVFEISDNFRLVVMTKS